MHFARTLSTIIEDVSQSFRVLLLTGPRQVGKTTILQSLRGKDRSYVSLDDLDTRWAAQKDPAMFIKKLRLPTLIDEVQYVPDLFPYIKMHVDEHQQNGLFWLTGSQQFSMMKNVTESLAGRIALLTLQGISLAEEEGRPQTPPFLPTPDVLHHRQTFVLPASMENIYTKIWRGSYPHLVNARGHHWQRFYESYVSTYIERDVRDYLRIDNIMTWRKFMQMAAARTGQMLNYRDIARDMGVSEPTIKSWFQVLQATGLIVIIPPYYNNLTKRLIKTPKFYFMDTGLCCYLTRWLSPEVLERGAMSGAMLETYVVSEIIKSYIHNGLSPQIYYYADKDKREVDVLLVEDGVIYPIEIKKTSSIRNSSFKGFDFLSSLNSPIGHGCVLCFHDKIIPFNEHIDIVPVGYI